MKIITLNIAGRTNFGRDFDERMASIAEFLDREQADIVCMQEMTFDDLGSLADKINAMMKNPYPNVSAEMSEKWTFDRFTESAKKRWAAGLFEHADDYLTDGLAVLSKSKIIKTEVIRLTAAPTDNNGRPDNRVRIAQNVDFEDGLKISNVHFATNNNGHLQLYELVGKIDGDRLIVGDFNIPHQHVTVHGNVEISGMQDFKNIWCDKYNDSTEFSDYVSFPDDNTAFDHLLLPKNYRFISIRTIDGLSDHSAVVFEIERISD